MVEDETQLSDHLAEFEKQIDKALSGNNFAAVDVTPCSGREVAYLLEKYTIDDSVMLLAEGRHMERWKEYKLPVPRSSPDPDYYEDLYSVVFRSKQYPQLFFWFQRPEVLEHFYAGETLGGEPLGNHGVFFVIDPALGDEKFKYTEQTGRETLIKIAKAINPGLKIQFTIYRAGAEGKLVEVEGPPKRSLTEWLQLQ